MTFWKALITVPPNMTASEKAFLWALLALAFVGSVMGFLAIGHIIALLLP